MFSDGFSWGRVYAIVLRYLYLLRGSWPRIIDQVYWPTVQMIIWGLVTRFFSTHSSWVAQAGGVLIAAVLLWDVLFRAQLGVSVVFMEELYARNLGHLFSSPLRPYEFICALLVISVLRALIGVGAAALLAIPLYHYSLFDMGLPLIAFFSVLLMFGWAVGLLICAALLRYGLGVESLAWASIFALAPISGIYYPISTLPEMVRPLAWTVPSSYVFEGMRAVLIEHWFDLRLFAGSVLTALLYLALGVWVLFRTFQSAREQGLLLQTGE
jgi:ABC-2 type transport system permease protein